MELNKKNLSDQVYEHIKQSILENKINFGEKLINRELQLKYGVSSTPVRDAINRLTVDGLVDNITNSGAKVIDFDLQFTLDVNEMISVLCCASVELASLRADHKTICRTLGENLEKQISATGSDDFYSYDYSFHKIFFDYCGNSHCLKSYEQYHVLRDMLVRRFHYFQKEQNLSVEQHRSIYEAFKEKRFADAHGLMKEHFLRAEKIFKQYME